MWRLHTVLFLINGAVRSGAAGAPWIARIDVDSIAPARAVINIREGNVEVTDRFDQVGRAIGGQVGVYVVHVNPVTQGVIGKHIAAGAVINPTLIPRKHATYYHAKRNIDDIICQTPSIGETRDVAAH